jgi:hypothetical protein
MPAEIAELAKIVLYLLLTLGAGLMVAVLSILLIILLGALGAWLVLHAAPSKGGSLRL